MISTECRQARGPFTTPWLRTPSQAPSQFEDEDEDEDEEEHLPLSGVMLGEAEGLDTGRRCARIPGATEPGGQALPKPTRGRRRAPRRSW